MAILATLKARLKRLEESARQESKPPVEYEWRYRTVWPDGTIEPLEPDPHDEASELIEWGSNPLVEKVQKEEKSH